MITLNSVPTTCTAKLLTGFTWNRKTFLPKDDPKRTMEDDKKELAFNKTILSHVEHLIASGFMLDFKILHCFTTDLQLDNTHVREFLEAIGFKEVFTGTPDRAESREKGSGTLHLWACNPKDYKEGLLKYKNELLLRQKELDRPKIPDPERQKFPELRLFSLRREGLVRENTRVDNPIGQVLLVERSVFVRHIKMKYGYDISKIDLAGLTTRYLKELHEQWRNEPCVYA